MRTPGKYTLLPLVDLIRARQEFAGVSDRYEGDHRQGADIQVDMRMAEDFPYYMQEVVRELLQHEKDAVYRAFVASGAEWTALRSTVMESHDLSSFFNTYRMRVRVDAVAADHRVRVFVPVASAQIPRDTHKCTYCGGYTYNDKRGNCAACGGPRTEDPNKWGWLHS